MAPAQDTGAADIDGLSPRRSADDFRLAEPGRLLQELLLTDHTEEEERQRSRERSPTPKPKKMPRKKTRPPPQPADVAFKGSVLMASKPKVAAPAPPVMRRTLVDDRAPEESWRQQQEEAGAFFHFLSGGGEQRSKAMEVLARHSARLGPEAAKGLEAAVGQAVERALEANRKPGGQAEGAKAEPFLFLQSEASRAAFLAAKGASSAVYRRRGRTPEADKEVRCQLGTAAFAERLGDEACGVSMGTRPPLKPVRPRGQADLILVPIGQLRFAHNDQSEHFVNTREDCSILQLAVELVAGITPLEAVPVFDVCWHAGQWYARSGNRRLAAFALAALFAPDRIHSVWVRRVAADATFLHGNTNGGRPKLTTHFNGQDCEGRWLVIKQTGEAVGTDVSCLSRPPYGADLLMLLPRPVVAREEAAGAGGDAEAPEREDVAAGGE